MDHAAFLVTIREQSERFLEALAGVPGDAAVPTCPGWTADDLVWHLGEVQHHWARVAEGLQGDEVPEPERPAGTVDLRRFVARAGTDLLGALAERDPAAPCWSWHPDGGTLGWVARRQAHEALVHRVDAELTAGLDVRPPSLEVAVDGVDEVLMVLVDGVPDWGSFTRDGVRVRLSCTNAPASWVLELGHFTGTGPESGKEFYLDAAAVRSEDVPADGVAPLEPPVDALVAGRAWDLDRWLWGRGDLDPLDATGDPALLERVRVLLTDATQ
jgi:uncharacterized protein (TIGR03083 family)